MSQIKMTIVSINGRPVNIPTSVRTNPRGSDCDKVANIYEFRIIVRIDRKFHRDQPNASFR